MYSDLTDLELDEKIVELRTKVEQVVGGGGVAVLAGEGRRVEYTRGNVAGLEALLTEARNEKERRGNGGRLRGRAIGVRHDY